MGDGARQYLVYSMNLQASEPLAMVLPIPVAAGSGENAVRFINLHKYPAFFSDLASGFEAPRTDSMLSSSRSAVPSAALPVVQVGSFEASFVPQPADFSRLDERFRLPPSTFKQLKGYENYGFAVFKLKPGAQTVHPMAFEFPTALPTQLFFPTVHIHDGKVHERAEFDHALYCQSTETLRLQTLAWEESSRLAGKFSDVAKSEGILLGREHCHRLKLHGMLANRDTFLKAVN